MLILLEDSKQDLESLIEALTSQGIERERIRDFGSLVEARVKLRGLNKEELDAFVIIADLGLGDERENGIDFIYQQFHQSAEKGGGVWTVLVSVADLLQRDFDAFHPLPHMTYDKNVDGWQHYCAQHIKSLFFSPFDFDHENDFAPPAELNIPPTDRIFFYSSGDAEYLSPDKSIDTSDYFAFQLSERDRTESESSPILMYRGRYIHTKHFNEKPSPRIVRILLRWRTAALACARPDIRETAKEVLRGGISLKHICSWKKVFGEVEPELDEEHGFHIRSVVNDVGAFRREPRVIDLETFLFPTSKKKVLKGFPGITRGSLPNLDESVNISDGALAKYELPFLEKVGKQGVEDNFLTRLHFVLSEEEVENFIEWKTDWLKYFLLPDSMTASLTE
jgi:hypothetical protein